ncbi:MAG TPA: trehalose-phosphatase [Mariniphaga sp.]|nr:trehalose-phosphatase [Mariniphaga sp.]
MKALIIDMSEVIVRTAAINKTAWEAIINEYFRLNKLPQSFSEEDYHKWFEGKPRFDRVKQFFNSYNINLHFGSQNEPADFNTICGLEKKKSKLFSHLLREGHLHVYEKAVAQIRAWKEKGIKTAIVSSDENFKKALKRSELKDLFDIKIDGHASRKMGFKEKPEADLYLEAVKELGYPPESCILFDDTVAGVQAGSKANFGLVVGVNRRQNKKQLSEGGADIVIDNFDELDLYNDPDIKLWFSQPTLPFASQYVRIMEAVSQKTPVLFLDYDGTLTPIVQNPDDAVISEEMKNVLKDCASVFTVAAVSGRDMDDLQQKIGLNELIYAGSHGFRISGPDGLYHEHEKTREILPLLDQFEKDLQLEFNNKIKGVQFERKRYAIAIHYRNASMEDYPEIKKKVIKLLQGSESLKMDEGKKIIEVKPAIEWDKGKAVLWILEKLGLTDKNKYIPIYIGDDTTDEDAYKSLTGWGLGIQVGPGAESSAAQYRIKNVYQVRILLKELAQSIA